MKTMMIQDLRKVIKRMLDPLQVMLTCARWYAAYPLGLRPIEAMMAERGAAVHHATVHRWAIEILPVPAAVFGRRKRPLGVSWRMDEACSKVAGRWKYLYRAVDGEGHTFDFLLCAERDCAAARCFLERAIDLHGVPETIAIDKRGANTVAIKSIQTDSDADIEMRRIKSLNYIVEQDHRAIKRAVRVMLGFKTLRCACALIGGHRNTAQDPQRSARCPRGPSPVRSQPVLPAGY